MLIASASGSCDFVPIFTGQLGSASVLSRGRHQTYNALDQKSENPRLEGPVLVQLLHDSPLRLPHPIPVPVRSSPLGEATPEPREVGLKGLVWASWDPPVLHGFVREDLRWQRHPGCARV